MRRADVLAALSRATSSELARELSNRRRIFAGGTRPLEDGTPEELDARRRKREAQARWRAKQKGAQ